MDDLAQLQSRVEAARDRLGDAEADQRKYGLRLDDLVRIVEGALSRQLGELNAAKAKSAALEIELEVARNAVSRGELELVARETDLAKTNAENEQLRGMVKTLLDLVEGRNVTPMREAMVRLEKGVRGLLTGGAKPTQIPVEAPAPKPQPTITPRPVLVANREIAPRIAPAEPVSTPAAAEAAPADDALVELISIGRSNSAEIVRDPPGATNSAVPFERPYSTEM
jgi:hypothetical protein